MMRVFPSLRPSGTRLLLWLAATLSASAANAQLCDCGPGGPHGGTYGRPGGPYANGFIEGGDPLYVEEALPPAVILERNPCRFTPHDVDPCYDMRCHLFPDSPMPWFYVQADFVPFFRDSAETVVFQALRTEGVASDVVLSSETIDMEFQGGLHFLFGARINELYRVESSFTGFQHWSAADTVRDFTRNTQNFQGNLFSPFSNFGTLNPDGGAVGITGLDFNHFASLTLQSSYDSAESNVLVDIPRMRNLESAVMLGVRYNKIDEQLTYQTRSPLPAMQGASVGIANAVTNDMIGLQLGYRARFLVETRMWLDFEMKGAIYHDDMEHNLIYVQTQADAVVGAFSDQAELERTPFGGDLSLILHYLVTPAFAVRLGYQALYFDGLALAAENAIPEGMRVTTSAQDPSTLVFEPLEIDHDGRVIYHGPVIGVVGMW